jgi:hypothetical protein
MMEHINDLERGLQLIEEGRAKVAEGQEVVDRARGALAAGIGQLAGLFAPPSSTPADTPRQKRPYTRRAKTEAEAAVDHVSSEGGEVTAIDTETPWSQAS